MYQSVNAKCHRDGTEATAGSTSTVSCHLCRSRSCDVAVQAQLQLLDVLLYGVRGLPAGVMRRNPMHGTAWPGRWTA